MWRAISGFDEGNDYSEMNTMFLAKMMKQINEAVMTFIQPIIFHSNDAMLRDPLPAEQNITKIFEDEVCYGESEDRLGMPNEMYWGARGVVLPDNVI
jgi:hypothetical protein